MNNTLPDWMKELANEKNNEEFSQLCHDYFQLATMRVMQEIRKKHDVPPSGISTLTIAIFAKFMNESCYAVGGAIRGGMKLEEIFNDQQLLVILKILTGQPLEQLNRDDIDTDLQRSLQLFKEFILKNGKDFHV